MRSIIRKLDRGQNLNSDEYSRLMEYLENLRLQSADSYYTFAEKYQTILAREYSTYLPRYAWDIDDLLNFLTANPEVIASMEKGYIPWDRFPPQASPYLSEIFGDNPGYQVLKPFISLFKTPDAEYCELPAPRQGYIVYKYEDANPYKEKGLFSHFQRLSKYDFITRLQTYRYLTRSKASYDKIELVAPDKLGGIFTNNDKSIYYYIFLTEINVHKAKNACHLLNRAFYNFNPGE